MHIDFNKINGFDPMTECDCNQKLTVGLTFKQKDYNNNRLSTYVIIHIDTINNNVIIQKMIDDSGNFCLHQHKFEVYHIDVFLHKLTLKFNHKYGDRIYFDKNKEKERNFLFTSSYVKNEIHVKLANDFITFVINNPLRFKTSIATRYDYVDYKTFKMEKVEYIKYEMVFNKTYQWFHRESKKAQFK